MSAKIPPGAEGVRLRRPVTASEVDAIQANAAKVQQHSSSRRPGREPMIRELLNRQAWIMFMKLQVADSDFSRRNERIWAPNFSTAVRLLFLIRFVGAMYTGISDCDESKRGAMPADFVVDPNLQRTTTGSPCITSSRVRASKRGSTRLCSHFAPGDIYSSMPYRHGSLDSSSQPIKSVVLRLPI